MPYVTPGTVAAGDVATAAAWNVLVGNDVALAVPPSCMVVRTTNLTGYASDSAITWQSELWDTDSMYSSGTGVTINTTGIYLLSLYVDWSCAATATLSNPNFAINGTPTNGSFQSVVSGTSGAASVSLLISLSATDVVTGRIGWVGGSSFVIGGNATANHGSQSRMSVMWMGKTA